MATRRWPSAPRTFRLRLTAEDEQRLRARAHATGQHVRTLLHADLRTLGEQLRLHTDDGLHVTLVGDELRITLTPVGERRLTATRDDYSLTETSSPNVDDRFDALTPPVTVVSAEQAENADLVVCVTGEAPSYFNDDVHTVCADCGVPIHHRPHAPQRPKKVCLDCAGKAALN